MCAPWGSGPFEGGSAVLGLRVRKRHCVPWDSPLPRPAPRPRVGGRREFSSSSPKARLWPALPVTLSPLLATKTGLGTLHQVPASHLLAQARKRPVSPPPDPHPHPADSPHAPCLGPESHSALPGPTPASSQAFGRPRPLAVAFWELLPSPLMGSLCGAAPSSSRRPDCPPAPHPREPGRESRPYTAECSSSL